MYCLGCLPGSWDWPTWLNKPCKNRPRRIVELNLLCFCCVKINFEINLKPWTLFPKLFLKEAILSDFCHVLNWIYQYYHFHYVSFSIFFSNNFCMQYIFRILCCENNIGILLSRHKQNLRFCYFRSKYDFHLVIK